MTKPLAWFLQLFALTLIVYGAMMEPMGQATILIGIVIAIIAGVGIRRRLKQG